MDSNTPRRARPAAAGRALAGAVLLAALAQAQPVAGERAPVDGEAAPAVEHAAPARRSATATAAGHQIVVTDHALATRAAAGVLERGGNAVDAAVTAAFTLAVVSPEDGNLGGGGFMLVHTAGGETVMIDYRETATAAATPDMFLDEAGELDPRLSLESGLAVGVPGSVAGMAHAHRRFGTRPWRELLEPAARLAGEGFVVDRQLEAVLAEKVEKLGRSTETARVFLGGGERPPGAGETLVQTDLARTLHVIQERGAPGFYTGEVAARLVAEVKRWGGNMTLDDLGRYRVVERPAVTGRYRGLDVLSASPPSSGGAVLMLMLHMVEQLALTHRDRDAPSTSHLILETMRRAYALRSTEFGDPDFVEVPLERLLDEGFAGRLAASIDPAAATPSDSLGSFLGDRPRRGAAPREGSNTTSFLVADRAGNVVANTTTLNASFGCGLVVTGGGFLLNNELDDFTAKPGAPNLYGLVQGERNRIEPGKRPISSMTPTILLRDGRPVMVLGSPGGSRIINAVFQVIVHQVEFGLDPGAAVERPRLHHQYLPDRSYHEAGALAGAARAWLARAGHAVTEAPWPIGVVHLAVRRADGVWVGVADARRGGAAIGLE